MDYGLRLWAMGYGVWDMEYGLWLMSYGLWVMSYGLWVMSYGLWVTGYGVMRMTFCRVVHLGPRIRLKRVSVKVDVVLKRLGLA
eukprot:1081752-Amorphochlora_amoeboformis.AAC.2